MNIKRGILYRVIYSALALFVVGAFTFLFFESSFAQFTPPCDTPPNCQPEGGGATTAGLFDILTNAFDAADASLFGGNVSIGGASTTPARLGLGTSTPGYPLDIVTQSADTDKDTSILRLAYNAISPVWTGLKLDRKPGDEKWFVGMASSTNNFVIQANGNDKIVDIDATKGAACIGATFQGISSQTNMDAVNGYDQANKKCPAGSHVCSIDEMYRTILCNQSKINSEPANAAWINGGLITSDPKADCIGWTMTNDNSRGSYWIFDGATNGHAESVNCSLGLQFACCR